MSVLMDVSTGTVETRISKLRNREANSTKITKTVRRHNTETREMKLMVRKRQKFQKKFQRKTHKAAAKTTTVNCNHSKLLKEISPREVQNQHTQINYKNTHDTMSVKQQEQRTQ